MKRSWLRALAAAGLAAFLSGCASTYLLDNNVQSFSGLPTLPANPTYRFERLPSQAHPGQAQLEPLADSALHRAGLRRDDAAPRYSVQVSARMQRVLSPWADPWDGLGGGFGFPHGGLWGPFPRMESPWYQREVAVIVREIAANRVVYESRASNDGPWLESHTVLPAMFDAALQGFPNPPAGARRVNIQLGGAKAQPAPAAVTPAPAPAR